MLVFKALKCNYELTDVTKK